MRYYVIRVEYVRSAKAENRQMYAFDTADAAVAQFHSIMAQDMMNTNLDWALVMVLNSAGGVHRSEKWVNPVPEVVEEPSTDETEETEETSEETTATDETEE